MSRTNETWFKRRQISCFAFVYLQSFAPFNFQLLTHPWLGAFEHASIDNNVQMWFVGTSQQLAEYTE